MLLSDVAELYDLLVEYKGCTADYMVSLTKGNWTIAEGWLRTNVGTIL